MDYKESSTEDNIQINPFRVKELLFRRQKPDDNDSGIKKKKKKKNQLDEFESLEQFVFKHSNHLIDTSQLDQGDYKDSVNSLGNSVYELKRNPGLLILPQALSIQQQMNWAIQAVRSFPLAPYSNLTNLGQNASDLWSLCSENDFSAFKKLRWVNLGYSYDWTLRQYKISEEISSRIPQEISSRLSKIAIDCKTCDSFNAETAIINYYYLDSSMGPHVDDAEFDLSRPVISASLGASAVFLIGGTSKDIEPTSLLVHSGDVVILSGKSRDCFHAVPRILPCSNSKFEEFKHVINDIEDIHDPMEKEKMLKFLCQTRINMNIRQIFSKQN